MNTPAPTLHAELLNIHGADALAFAQAQLSSDVLALHDGQWQWSAWLDVRGRVRALLQLARIDATHLQALLRGGSAQTLVDALRPYMMRSAVTVQARQAGALRTGTALSMAMFEQSAQADAFGFGDCSLCVDADTTSGDDEAMQSWRLSAIRAGHPWLPDAALSEFVPQALSLERLTAVSFSKGCFPGQEIVARLHYRGGHKKHLCRITAKQPMLAGDALRHADTDVGMVLDAVIVAADAYEALVVLRDDIAAMPSPLLQFAQRAPRMVHVEQTFAA